MACIYARAPGIVYSPARPPPGEVSGSQAWALCWPAAHAGPRLSPHASRSHSWRSASIFGRNHGSQAQGRVPEKLLHHLTRRT